MAVLRLLGLNMEAGSGDIRSFFSGLHIPEGGVHITGGTHGEAFIIFTTEKDGLLALQRSGASLKGSRVILSMSSQAELRNKMESCLKKCKYLEEGSENKSDRSTVGDMKQEAAMAILLSLVSAVGHLQKEKPTAQKELPGVDNHHEISLMSNYFETLPANCFKRSPLKPKLNTRYLSVRGLPSCITKHEICSFFEGLKVREVIVNAKIGQSRGCLVKFGTEQDSCEGLKYDGQIMGSSRVEVREATQEAWFAAVSACELISRRQRETSREKYPVERSRSPIRQKSNRIPTTKDYNVMVQNLHPATTKTEIKNLFGCTYIPNNRVLHLLDNRSQRTDTAFLIFDCKEDYVSALNLNGCSFLSQVIRVSAIERAEMIAMLKRGACSASPAEMDRAEKRTREPYPPQSCIYMRNLPADIRKVEIKDFFRRFSISEDCIHLLCDIQGNGIGEAVVRFESVELARRAKCQNGRNFLGTPVLLTYITEQQLDELLTKKL